MKITQLLIIVAAGFGMMSSCTQSSDVALNTQADTVSYVLGAAQAKNMIMNFERAKIDSLIDTDLYLKGFKDAANGKELDINPESERQFLDDFFKENQMAAMQAMRDTTGQTPGFSPSKGRVDSVSYLLGADFGQSLSKDFKDNGFDTVLSIPIIASAFVSSMKGEEPKLNPDEHMQELQMFFQELQQKQLKAQYGENIAEGEEFLAKNKAEEGVVTTESGLQYKIIVEGTGAKPTATDKVKVHYTGMLLDSTIFDSSVERGEPAVFGVGQVISGWTEALQLMPVGSKWRLYIPYDLAYGERGAGQDIPPYSTLIFDVELLSIEK